MQAYSDPKRESDPHALPDIEVFQDFAYECDECGAVTPSARDYYGIANLDCPECGAIRARIRVVSDDPQGPAGKFWYWICFPGCLPDGAPIGPFETAAEALADAREG